MSCCRQAIAETEARLQVESFSSPRNGRRDCGAQSPARLSTPAASRTGDERQAAASDALQAQLEGDARQRMGGLCRRGLSHARGQRAAGGNWRSTWTGSGNRSARRDPPSTDDANCDVQSTPHRGGRRFRDRPLSRGGRAPVIDNLAQKGCDDLGILTNARLTAGGQGIREKRAPGAARSSAKRSFLISCWGKSHCDNRWNDVELTCLIACLPDDSREAASPATAPPP